MHATSKLSVALTASLLWSLAAGCGDSSTSPNRDSAVDRPSSVPDSPVVPKDGAAPGDLPLETAMNPDVAPPGDVTIAIDTTKLDSASPPVDAPPVTLDTAAGEALGMDGASGQLDGGAPGLDSAPALDAPQEAPTGGADAPADGFSPGPATLIVVNSGNTGTFNLSDGTWKVFYFDAAAGQIYCMSGLSSPLHGYVGTSATVSPTSHQYETDAAGNLAFTAATAQRYYVAVAVSGGGSSGALQVADGGQLLALGANTVSLAAPDLDNTYVFRFPIGAGHAYSLSVSGPAATSASLAVSPQAERSAGNQFLTNAWGKSGALPFTNEAITTESVALSYSGFYYFTLRVYAAVTLTVTVAQTS